MIEEKKKRCCRACGVELNESNQASTEDELCWECESDEAMEEGLEEW
jgi:hypothetical protein